MLYNSNGINPFFNTTTTTIGESVWINPTYQYTSQPKPKCCDSCCNCGCHDKHPKEQNYLPYQYQPYYTQPCAIEEFFKANPDAGSVMIYCSCPKCTPR